MRKILCAIFANVLLVACVLGFAMFAASCNGTVEEIKHEFGEWIEEVSPTCEQAGVKGHYHCTHCDKDFDKEEKEILDLVIPANGHEVNEMVTVKPATCLDAGEKYYSCKHCEKKLNDKGEVITENMAIAPLGHHMVDVEAKAETCTVDGNIAYSYCDRCNEYYIDGEGEEISAEDVVVAAHHTLGEVIAYAAPTCTEKGMKAHYYCSACDTYLTADKVETTLAELEIKETGHNPSECYFWEQTKWVKTNYCADCGSRIKDNDVDVEAVPTNAIMRMDATTTEFSIEYDLDASCINNSDWTQLFNTPGGASYIFAGCIKDQKDSDDAAGLHQQFCDMQAGLGQNSPLYGRLNSTWLSAMGAGHYVLSFNADKSVRWFKDGQLIFYYYKDTVDSNDGATMSVAELRDIIVTDIVSHGLVKLVDGVTNVKFGPAVDFEEIPFRFELNGKLSDINYIYALDGAKLEDLGYDVSCITEKDGIAVIHQTLDRDIKMGENTLAAPIAFDHPAGNGDWWTNHFGEYPFADGDVYEFELSNYAEYYDSQSPDAGWASLIVMITTSNPFFKQLAFWPMNGINNKYNCDASTIVVTEFAGTEDIIHGATVDATYWYAATIRVQKEGRLVIVDCEFRRNDGKETINRSFVAYLTGEEECQLSLSGEWCLFSLDSVKKGTALTHEHKLVETYTIGEEGHYHKADCAGPDGAIEAHDFKFIETVAPTATEKGYDLYRCICGAEDKRNFKDPVETHNFEEGWTKTETEHYHKCLDAGCEAKQGAAAHDFNDGVVKTKPTCDAAGVKEFTCLTCGYVKEEPIEKLAENGQHNLETIYMYEDGQWYKQDQCKVCEYKADKIAVATEDVPATATSYDGLMNESYWNDAAKAAAHVYDLGGGRGTLTVNAVKTADGFHIVAVERMTQYMELSDNWWENDNVEFRIRPMYDFYDKFNKQLYASTLNGGTSNFTKAYVAKSEDGDTKIVTYELFVTYTNNMVGADATHDFAIMWGSSSGAWFNCASWRNIGGSGGAIYTVDENGIAISTNPLLLIDGTTGTEILTEHVVGDCPELNSAAYALEVDGTKDWSYKITLTNIGWKYVDTNDFWPNFVGNVKAKGTNQDDGWVFRADWWGWGAWNHGATAGNIGDCCGVPDGGWYKAFMSDATCQLLISFDAQTGIISIFGYYIWNVDNSIVYWTAFQSAQVTYRGDMILSLGGDHSYIDVTSVQKIK